MKAMTRFFFRYFLWFVPFWYGLTMRLTRVKGVQVMTPDSPSSIAAALAYGRRWRRDPLKGKMDVLSHPTRVQRRIDKGEPIGDCDDHAIIWCVALWKGRFTRRLYFAYLQYVDEKGKQSGHVVCNYQALDGKWYWADYDRPQLHDGGLDWAHRVATAYGGTPVCAAMIEIKDATNDNPKFGRTFKQVRFQEQGDK